MSCKKAVFLAAFTLSVTQASCGAWAKEALGPVYPIVEADMMEAMMMKLKKLESNGTLEQLRKEAINRSLSYANKPQATPGLSPALKANTWLVDPSYIAAKDITTPDGKFVAHAGEKVNPLDYVPLSRYLILFNGESEKEVRTAKKLGEYYKGQVKYVLEAGSPVDLSKKWNTQVYFDQNGALVHKFGIRHTPAMISQEGKQLRIDEVIAE